MQKTKVGVLRGGPGDEHEVSLETGKNVLANMPDKYDAYDIYISPDNSWYLGGICLSSREISERVDVFFNALHGVYGEGGRLQQELDRFAPVYTGSNPFSSASAMNKVFTKKILAEFGVLMPNYMEINRRHDLRVSAEEVLKAFPRGCVIKPVSNGSSVGVLLASSPKEILNGLKETLSLSENVLVEEYIKGREATCGVIDSFRDEKYYSLPVVEIRIPADATFFDYSSKYEGVSDEICPGNFTRNEKDEIEYLAAFVHDALKLRHYSRSDFIVSPKGIYFLEVNTLPGLTGESLLPKSLSAVGATMEEFLDHVINLAMARK